MSAHRRMRSYMERHKVGALFEDLMSKLVSEMPSEPVPFLIRVLQQKLCQITPQTVMSIPQLRRSLGDITSSLEIEKVPVYRKPSSAVVKRSRPSTPSVQPHPPSRKHVTLSCPKDRTQEMEKPGVTCNPGGISVPVQNQLHMASNFLHEEHSVYPPKQNQPEMAASKTDPVLKHYPKWHPNSGYNGPILPGQVFDEDPLEEEILIFPSAIKQELQLKWHIGRQTKKGGCIPVKSSSCKTYPVKMEINAKCAANCGAVEMYEDPNDLASEGIFINPQPSGFKVNNDKFQNEVTKCQHWHFSMCSVCAKMLRSQDSTEEGMMEKCENLKTVSSQIDKKAVPVFKEEITKVDPVEETTETTTDAISPSVINYFSTDAKSPSSFSGLDTDRTISTDDLFATPRSLPLPSSPVHKVTVEWCRPTLESIHATGCGWEVVTADDSDLL